MAHNRTARVVLMMTPAELEAIDNWRFANRIPTRARAIRQLCAEAIDKPKLPNYDLSGITLIPDFLSQRTAS